MSERMIELHRARLLAAKGSGSNNNNSAAGGTSASAASTANTNGTQMDMPATVAGAMYSPSMTSENVAMQQTPQEAAVAATQVEDTHMQLFLHRFQDRNDARAQSASGPTVPVGLSRRMLQRQGVGFLDETVAALVSGAADRFLGTVLQQAAACRDQRLKGAQMAREARRHRKRHIQQYEADSAERTRRKEEKEANRARVNDARIEAAEALKKSTNRNNNDGRETPSKSKKKKKPDDPQLNGNKIKQKVDDDMGDDDLSYDSVDEEEQYYRNSYGDGHSIGSGEEEEAEDVLMLRDISRPLAAWGFHFEGKAGMEQSLEEDSDENDSESESDKDELDSNLDETGDADDTDKDEKQPARKPPPGASAKAAKSPETDKAARKTSSSPAPPSRATTPVKLN